MSRLIRMFTVCLVNLIFHSSNLKMKQTRSLSEFTWCPNIPDFTLLCDHYEKPSFIAHVGITIIHVDLFINTRMTRNGGSGWGTLEIPRLKPYWQTMLRADIRLRVSFYIIKRGMNKQKLKMHKAVKNAHSTCPRALMHFVPNLLMFINHKLKFIRQLKKITGQTVCNFKMISLATKLIAYFYLFYYLHSSCAESVHMWKVCRKRIDAKLCILFACI